VRSRKPKILGKKQEITAWHRSDVKAEGLLFAAQRLSGKER
jgi:hypothetical protein